MSCSNEFVDTASFFFTVVIYSSLSITISLPICMSNLENSLARLFHVNRTHIFTVRDICLIFDQIVDDLSLTFI